jgi:ferredoxin
VLTPEFGPLQRFAFVLTDAPLAPDPPGLFRPVCDRCGDCIRACPGQAIGREPGVTVRLGSRVIEHAALDEWQCAAYYLGADGATNPFLPDRDAARIPAGARLDEAAVRSLIPLLRAAYPPVRFGYESAVCGRACWRACYARLEKANRLDRGFDRPFRERPPWRIPRPGP